MAPEYPVAKATPIPVTGRIGIRDEIAVDDWSMRVEGPDGELLDELVRVAGPAGRVAVHTASGDHPQWPEAVSYGELLDLLEFKDLQDLPEEDRSLWTERRNFAAQRGIVLDEAASLFSSFKRDYNAGLPYYLLRLSDCDTEVEKLTRGSGKVVAHNTYLSFLGSTTAAALMRTDLDFLWASGCLWPPLCAAGPQ